MIIEEFQKLPPLIQFEGVNFELQLINNGGNESRLVYTISYASDSSPHKADIDAYGCWSNKLADPDDQPSQGFLVLYEGIYNDVDLCWAIRRCWHWLWDNGLMTDHSHEAVPPAPAMPGV